MQNIALELNKYANRVISEFNNMHNTTFSCLLGLGESYRAKSSLEHKTNQIKIALPIDCLDDAKNSDEVEALKLAIGHEISYHIYANMNISAFETIGAKIKNKLRKSDSTYRNLMISCCIETAADIHSEQFYSALVGDVTAGIYLEYQNLLLASEDDVPSTIISNLNKGRLPAEFRILIMKHYKSFKGEDYEILQRIANDISVIIKRNTGKSCDMHKNIQWIQAQLDFEQFPNRINKLG